MNAKLIGTVKNIGRTFVKPILPKPIWTFLRHNATQLRIQVFIPRWECHNYGGIELEVLISDPVSQFWYDHDRPEPEEITILKKHQLKNGATVFDLGANLGVVAAMLGKAVGTEGMVYAIEANKKNVTNGMKILTRNNVTNIDIIWSAAAEKSGTIAFNKHFNGWVNDTNSHLKKIETPSICIDDLRKKFGKPNVIYIDVEGYESKVLEGAKETFKDKPDFFVEVHSKMLRDRCRGGTVEDILSHFPQEQYKLLAKEENVGATFRDLEPKFLTTDDRFFLLAIAND